MNKESRHIQTSQPWETLITYRLQKCSFQRKRTHIPVELVYCILDNFDELTILLSLRNVCIRLNSIMDSYHRCKVIYFYLGVWFSSFSKHRWFRYIETVTKNCSFDKKPCQRVIVTELKLFIALIISIIYIKGQIGCIHLKCLFNIHDPKREHGHSKRKVRYDFE
jgi:hypothetical protein